MGQATAGASIYLTHPVGRAAAGTEVSERFGSLPEVKQLLHRYSPAFSFEGVSWHG